MPKLSDVYVTSPTSIHWDGDDYYLMPEGTPVKEGDIVRIKKEFDVGGFEVGAFYRVKNYGYGEFFTNDIDESIWLTYDELNEIPFNHSVEFDFDDMDDIEDEPATDYVDIYRNTRV